MSDSSSAASSVLGPHVVLYVSSTAADLLTKKAQTSLRFLMETKGVIFDEHDISRDVKARDELQSRQEKLKLPALFINGKYIGDYTEVQNLEENDQLDPLLK